MKQLQFILSLLILGICNYSDGLADNHFYLIPKEENRIKKNQIDSIGKNPVCRDNTNITKIITKYTPEDFSMLDEKELIELIRKYEFFIHKKKKSTSVKKNNRCIISYYSGDNHDLTLENLQEVMNETKISNQLFVLAQAILETGYFTSKVCKEYHNLFGLYDSKIHDYYRFERWEDSVIGYKKFIQYKFKGGNYLEFLKEIRYAEDPQYIYKVARIAKQLYEKLYL